MEDCDEESFHHNPRLKVILEKMGATNVVAKPWSCEDITFEFEGSKVSIGIGKFDESFLVWDVKEKNMI